MISVSSSRLSIVSRTTTVNGVNVSKNSVMIVFGLLCGRSVTWHDYLSLMERESRRILLQILWYESTRVDSSQLESTLYSESGHYSEYELNGYKFQSKESNKKTKNMKRMVQEKMKNNIICWTKLLLNNDHENGMGLGKKSLDKAGLLICCFRKMK